MKPRAVPALPLDRVRLTAPVRHYRCPRDWNWRSRLSDHDLWLVLAGEGRLVVNGVERRLTGPVATLLAPGDEVVGEHDPRAPFEVIALHFTPHGWGGADRKRWEEKLVQVALRPAARFRELGEQLAAESLAGDALGEQVTPELAFSLLAAVWRLAHRSEPEEGDDRVEELLRAIQRDPGSEWTLEGMAKRARMGTTRLNMRFRELTGHPPARWVIRCRLERACILLRETELKLASIADACGYRDVYFFVRQFRQMLGRPPGEWRKEAGKRAAS